MPTKKFNRKICSASDSTISSSSTASLFNSIDFYPRRAGRITSLNQYTGEILVTADILPAYRRHRTLTDKYSTTPKQIISTASLNTVLKLNTCLAYQPLHHSHIKRYCNSRKQLTRHAQRELRDFIARLFAQLDIKQLELFIAFSVLLTRFQLAETQPPRNRLDDTCFIAAIITQKKYQASKRLCEPEFDYIDLHFPTNQYNHHCILELKPLVTQLENYFLQTINSPLLISQTEFNQYYNFFQTSNRRHHFSTQQKPPALTDRQTLSRQRAALRDNI